MTEQSPPGGYPPPPPPQGGAYPASPQAGLRFANQAPVRALPKEALIKSVCLPL